VRRASHLGASAQHDDVVRARRESDRIARDLQGASTPDEKRALLSALGNAGSHDHVGTLAKYKDDPDADLRATAALALRKDPSPESRAVLMGMLVDKNGHVADASLDALGYQTVNADDVRGVTALVTSGQTSLDADPAMVTFLSKHHQPAAEARSALEYLLGRVDPRDYQEAQRIRNVLKQVAMR
jgi:HEAT repeat protein